MDVAGIDGELAQRGEDALLAEGAHGQVRIDPLKGGEIDQAVGHHGQLAEIDALRRQADGFRLAAPACRGNRLVALGAQLGRHLAGEQFDEAVAEQADRATLVGELRIEGVEIGAFEALGDEGVASEIGGTAGDRNVVTALAIVAVEPGRAAEHGIDRVLAQRRDDRLGRHRTAEAVGPGEACGEQGLAIGNQLVELVDGQRPLELLEDDVVVDRLFGPRRHVASGGRAGGQQQRRAKCDRPYTGLMLPLLPATPMRHALASV